MGVFDIMGPIMIGPSSSHTAGAAKLGRIASLLFNRKIEAAEVFFHGSFAETYRGHGTDRAVAGGILGFKPDDERIKDSRQIARERGINIAYQTIKLKEVHPNTMLIKLNGSGQSLTMLGSSIGGGNISVNMINDYQVNISGKLPTLWVLHQDQPGEIGVITSVLGSYSLNIAFMQVFRKKRGTVGSSIIELDHLPVHAVLQQLESIKNILQVRYIPPL